MRLAYVCALLAAAACAAPATFAVTTFSDSGATAADITDTRDAFRAALGGGTTAGANGSFGGVRREINWDGVPDSVASPNNLPANFFNANSPRGAVFASATGTFQVSANAGIAPVAFSNIDASYATLFAPFSAQRLFTATGTNVYDVQFFVPGTTTAALTRGFGAVFSDVDLANTTSIQFFDAQNASLGVFFVPPATGNQTFSFLGMDFDTPTVSRVRITQGNAALGAGVLETGTIDLVVADDFIYGEPTAGSAPAPVPEPSAAGLLALAVAGLIARRRCR